MDVVRSEVQGRITPNLKAASQKAAFFARSSMLATFFLWESYSTQTERERERGRKGREKERERSSAPEASSTVTTCLSLSSLFPLLSIHHDHTCKYHGNRFFQQAFRNLQCIGKHLYFSIFKSLTRSQSFIRCNKLTCNKILYISLSNCISRQYAVSGPLTLMIGSYTYRIERCI